MKTAKKSVVSRILMLVPSFMAFTIVVLVGILPEFVQKGYRPNVKDPRWSQEGKNDPKQQIQLLTRGEFTTPNKNIAAIFVGNCAPCAMSRLAGVDWKDPKYRYILVTSDRGMTSRLAPFLIDHPGVDVVESPKLLAKWNGYFAPRLYILSSKGYLESIQSPYSTVLKCLRGHCGID